ncbi:MAG: hypothetical protein A2284_07805 [Deltaproteobacteria bacterium RIFOXYA12_FULL_61_11]|nr:MAG: hypothetical protein A2284_07805 [Deltaproteobacteria bacterium RIFOXYA12_FULL_61_11]
MVNDRYVRNYIALQGLLAEEGHQDPAENDSILLRNSDFTALDYHQVMKTPMQGSVSSRTLGDQALPMGAFADLSHLGQPCLPMGRTSFSTN